MKPCVHDVGCIFIVLVAPFMGAWIETSDTAVTVTVAEVTPFMGAWIETTDMLDAVILATESHPSWVRGLKLCWFDV